MQENPAPQEKVIIANESARQAAKTAAQEPGDLVVQGLARIAADKAAVARAQAQKC